MFESASPLLNWESHWRNILAQVSAGGSKPLAFFDLDEFVFVHDTIGLGAAELACRGGNQSNFSATYELYKRGEIDFDMGELLTLGINDAVASFGTLEQYIDWVQPKQSVTKGFRELFAFLNENEICLIGITNGVTLLWKRFLNSTAFQSLLPPTTFF